MQLTEGQMQLYQGLQIHDPEYLELENSNPSQGYLKYLRESKGENYRQKQHKSWQYKAVLNLNTSERYESLFEAAVAMRMHRQTVAYNIKHGREIKGNKLVYEEK